MLPVQPTGRIKTSPIVLLQPAKQQNIKKYKKHELQKVQTIAIAKKKKRAIRNVTRPN